MRKSIKRQLEEVRAIQKCSFIAGYEIARLAHAGDTQAQEIVALLRALPFTIPLNAPATLANDASGAGMDSTRLALHRDTMESEWHDVAVQSPWDSFSAIERIPPEGDSITIAERYIISEWLLKQSYSISDSDC